MIGPMCRPRACVSPGWFPQPVCPRQDDVAPLACADLFGACGVNMKLSVLLGSSRFRADLHNGQEAAACHETWQLVSDSQNPSAQHSCPMPE